MRFLIVEDTPAEQKAAREAVKATGHECVVLYSIREAVQALANGGFDGVITDLHFPPHQNWEDNRRRDYLDNPPPSGICVAYACQALSIPVVMCTRCDSEGHHGETYSWLYDGFVGCFDLIVVAKAQASGLSEDNPARQKTWPGSNNPLSPFGWNEDKDWFEAVDQLIARIYGQVWKPAQR